MRRHVNPLLRKYEFESSRSDLANKFLRILYIFCVNPEDIYVMPDFFDISQIEFRTTQKKEEQMIYVFRRLTNAEIGDDYEIY